MSRQEAVKSLARDPTVWSAVLSNEKVMELARGLQDNGTHFCVLCTSLSCLMHGDGISYLFGWVCCLNPCLRNYPFLQV